MRDKVIKVSKHMPNWLDLTSLPLFSVLQSHELYFSHAPETLSYQCFCAFPESASVWYEAASLLAFITAPWII